MEDGVMMDRGDAGDVVIKKGTKTTTLTTYVCIPQSLLCMGTHSVW